MGVAAILDVYILTVFALKLFFVFESICQEFATHHLRHQINISTKGFFDSKIISLTALQ